MFATWRTRCSAGSADSEVVGLLVKDGRIEIDP